MRMIIQSDIANACEYVQKVISQGMISDDGKCYCYLTIFRDGTYVSCDKTKMGFKFNVWINNEHRKLPK